jgi:hypothetical protein
MSWARKAFYAALAIGSALWTGTHMWQDEKGLEMQKIIQKNAGHVGEWAKADAAAVKIASKDFSFMIYDGIIETQDNFSLWFDAY